jgi:hypothetical protein
MTMAETPGAALSVSSLFAEREARQRKEQEAEEHLKRKHQEELAEFKSHLDTFQLSDDKIHAVLDRVRRAFDRGETELMLTSFPSSFCTDGGRAVNNADLPPINKPSQKENEPEWLATLPAGARIVYEYWKTHLQPGGFRFSARIINYPGGIPGDVGLFLSWPKNAMDVGS